MSKVKKTTMILLVVLLSVLAVAATITTYAYFSKKEIYDGFFSGEVELLFDRLSDEGMAAYQATDSSITVNDSAWGTKEYPYVISDVRHLYNLSELQRLGYFYKMHISKNEDGNYSNIPYFLVCTPDYTPVLIDGTNFGGITSIGTDAYPFIGSVRGVQNPEAPITVDGKQCDTSAIYNVKVSGNPANADVGLFGHIGYLGDSAAVDENTGMFAGQISTLSNLVLVDMQITVKSSLWGTVTSFLEDIAINATDGHRYSFTDLYDTTDYRMVPHENHHIGILVGHASYTAVEYISVYYTSGEVVAIDLHDETEVDGVRANYLSATGILGFIDNINPTVTDDGNGNMSVSAGSGDSVGDISYGTVGGGGISSGTKSGYVLAAEMYTKYHYTKTDAGIVEDTDGTIYLKDAVSADGNALCTEWIRDRILWGTEATGRYYFYDGVFTFALSGQEDIIEPTWQDAPDEFSIGPNDPDKWGVNYSKGNKAVVAYVKKIGRDQDLQEAINSGKQIFILNENGDRIFLMSLFSASTAGSGDFEEKYSTNGVSQQFGSDEFVNSLIQSYEGGELTLPDDMSGYSKDDLVSALKSGSIRAINVGITSSTTSLETLKEQYKITAQATGNYCYFSGQTPVSVTSDGVLNEYYVYPINNEVVTDGYDGYIYYTVASSWAQTTYTYYWQSKDETTQIGTGSSNILGGSSNTPSAAFTDTGETWEGEKIYTYTYNGTTYKGVVVNKSDGAFYDSGNAANPNGADLTKPATTTVYYFYKNVGGTEYYHSTDPQTAISASSLTDTGNKSLSGQTIYSANGKTGVLLDRYPTYTFSSGENYLRMIKAVFSSYGNHYALWNGTDSAAEDTGSFTHTFVFRLQTPTSVSNTTQATLRFNADGTCYIQYGIDTTGLYVHATDSLFNTATSNTIDGTKLCIYTVEGTQDINYGRVTFDPIDDTSDDTDCYTFGAGETVLFADPTHTSDANGNIATTDTSYTVLSLEQLGWNNGSGQIVSVDDLESKFKMEKGITFGASFNLLNGTLGSSGIITAPVGTNGIEANIPQACVAFRINNPNAENKIRVIVSVAVSELYPTEEGYDLGDYTLYFNLWKMEEAGESTVQVFDATGENLVDRFEVPRSHPYEPGKTAADADSEYIIVTYNGNEYRCYLNGDRVLLAYEFSVDTTTEGFGVGVFCMGMSGIDADGNAVEDVPMEIVYFSAEGVASAGRDGVSGSQIGTIDFVYDYENVIVTVKESSETDTDGNEVYSNYYPSYCLMYFNTSKHADSYTDDNPVFMDVNYEYIRVRRYVLEESETPASDENHNDTPSRTVIAAVLDGDKNTCIVQYSRYADNVRVTQ